MFRKKNEIDYDKLAQAIEKAHINADKEIIKQAVISANDELKKREKDKLEAKQKEWQKALNADNDLKMFFKILFLKKKDAKTLAANTTIMKISLIMMYWIFEYLIYLLAIGFIAVAFIEKTTIAISFAAGFFFIGGLIARIIRIARFEVDNIDDKNYLTTLFSSMLSLSALIIAIISIVVTQK